MKNITLTYFLLLSLVLFSCKDALVTNNEKDAVQKVLNFYGGICNRSKGFTSKNGDMETYFVLEMEKSNLIESYSEILELPASNIAYLFYSNLRNEQKNYTTIKVVLKLENGKAEEFEYSTWKLKQIKKIIPALNSIIDDVKYQNFKNLHTKFDPMIAKDITPEALKDFLFPTDSAYGITKEYQFHGFNYFYDEDNRPLIELVNVMMREKANTPLIIVLDKKNKTILGIKDHF